MNPSSANSSSGLNNLQQAINQHNAAAGSTPLGAVPGGIGGFAGASTVNVPYHPQYDTVEERVSTPNNRYEIAFKVVTAMVEEKIVTFLTVDQFINAVYTVMNRI